MHDAPEKRTHRQDLFHVLPLVAVSAIVLIAALRSADDLGQKISLVGVWSMVVIGVAGLWLWRRTYALWLILGFVILSMTYVFIRGVIILQKGQGSIIDLIWFEILLALSALGLLGCLKDKC